MKRWTLTMELAATSGEGENTSLAVEAYHTVRRRILRGELRMGQNISRRKIATELGMSFLPVSEALLRLELEGLLESRARAGTRIRIPTAEDVLGHYVVREALEVQSARLFSQTASVDEQNELARLAARVDGMSTEPDSDRMHYLSLHEKFHRRIAECARSKALSAALEQTHALASTWMCVGPSASTAPRRTHQDLMHALTQGVPEIAGEAMRRHVLSSRERAMERLKPYFQLNETRGTSYTRSAKKLSAASRRVVPAT
jgi:DNA-binding GntR family transcriptional regulator